MTPIPEQFLGLLPNAADAEEIQFRIATENGNVTGKRLRSDHSIEGIAMFAWKTPGPESGFDSDGKKRISGIIHHLQKLVLDCLRSGKFA